MIKKILKWLLGLNDPDNSDVKGMTQGLFETLKQMRPGQALRIMAPDGTKFVIMHSEDHEYMIQMAGYQAKEEVRVVH
jgi:hypothetical protein